MRALVLLLSLFVVSCGWFEKRKHDEKPIDGEVPQHVTDKGNLYCEQSYTAYLETKYVHSRCDGVGFTSLYAVGCQQNAVDLSLFEDSEGRVHRDPKHSCFDYATKTDNGSKAGFSKDMALMRMVSALELGDLGWVKRYIAFLKPRNYVMCDAINDVELASRCAMSPRLISLLYDIEAMLEGRSADARPKLPEETEPNPLLLRYNIVQQDDDATSIRADFEGHLDVLAIYADGRVRGAIKDSALKRLTAYAEREPLNGLYSAVYHYYLDGDQSRTWEILGADDHFPADRLPNNHEHHCTEYLYQRDMLKAGEPNSDWSPCGDRELSAHSGAEYNLARFIASKKK